ncbi:unnamed protein product [Closterium sp. NIES-53]
MIHTLPTLHWTGEISDASVFRVWGSRAFVRDTSALKLSARAIPCVFLGFPPDVPGWQFYHPTSRSVFPSQDVTFDKSVPFYCLFPYRSGPPPPPPLFLAPGPPPVDPLPPQGPAPSDVSQVDPLRGTVPIEVAVASGAAKGASSGGAASGGAEPGGAESKGAGSVGAEPWGAEPGGADPGGAEPAGAEPEGVERGGAESEGAESGGAEPQGIASSGGPAGASPRLSPRPEPLSLQQLREWFAQCTRLRSGAAGAGDSAAGDTRAGGAGDTAGAGGTRGAASASPGGARTRGTGAAGTSSVGGAGAGRAGARDPAEPGGAGAGGVGAGGTGAGGTGAGGDRAGDTGAVGAGAGGTAAGGAGVGRAGAGDTGAVDPGAGGAGAGGAMSGSTGARGTMQPLLSPPPLQPQPQLQPGSPLPAPSPYAEQTDSFTERREPESCPAPPACAVRTGCWVPRSRPPPVPGTHAMALRPSSVPLHDPLPPPPESSLLAVPYPESDLARAASPTVSRLLATVVTDPSFETTTASALVAELVDFAAACRLDYATALVAESESANPSSVGGECAHGTDVLEDRQEDFECLAAAVPRFASMMLAPKGDPDAPEAITGPYSSQWEKWPPGSPPAFKARYIARGFSQRQGVDYFQTFSPTRKMTTLQVLLHVAAQSDYELHSLDFSTAFLQGNLHEEIWLRHPPGFTGTTLAALGFAPSTADPSLFLCTDTSSPPFYVLVYVDELIFATTDTEALTLVKSELQKRHTCTDMGEMCSYLGLQITQPSGPYPELVGCLIMSGMGLVLGGRGPVVLTGHADASWVDDLATQRSSQGYTFSLGSGSVSWWSICSSSVLNSSCEAEIYVGAMAAQELRCLTYLLTDLGEQPRSPSVLYVDNKAMIALCQEHRIEYRTKHIALRYFLAEELQQRGQLRLAYVAIRANTADIFTKAFQSGDHQCFSTVLGLVPTLPHLLTA